MRSYVSIVYYTNFIKVRKWKRVREIGEGTWEFEIGEPLKAFNPENDLMAPSGDNVFNLFI
jgi:hypothetical protein